MPTHPAGRRSVSAGLMNVFGRLDQHGTGSPCGPEQGMIVVDRLECVTIIHLDLELAFNAVVRPPEYIDVFLPQPTSQQPHATSPPLHPTMATPQSGNDLTWYALHCFSAPDQSLLCVTSPARAQTLSTRPLAVAK
jgi:hypothetical protein